MEGQRLFVELVDPDKTEDGRYREGGVTETLSDRPGSPIAINYGARVYDIAD